MMFLIKKGPERADFEIHFSDFWRLYRGGEGGGRGILWDQRNDPTSGRTHIRDGRGEGNARISLSCCGGTDLGPRTGILTY